MSSVHTRLSTKASSIVLYRRLLFPSLPPTVSPPPLLPNASPALNAELYDFIALALRGYVTPWWSKITRYDREFVPHVAVVLGVVVRALERRLAAADMSHLFFRALPTLIAQHYADYRAAVAKVGTSYASGGAATLPQLFHQHQGHMGIDADGHIDPTYISHTLDLILQACLPTEDYESDAERAIIREVMAKVLLKDVIPLLCQPWFIHKLMLDQLSAYSDSDKPAGPEVKAKEVSRARARGPSIHTVVVFVLSAVQYLSGLCLTLIQLYKQTVHTVKLVNATDLPTAKEQRQFGASLLGCTSEVLNMRERTAASIVVDISESVLGMVEEFTDRLLVHMLQTHVLTEQGVLRTVKLSKQVLFPNGYPAPRTTIPSPEEQEEMKEELVRLVDERLPPIVRGIMLGPPGIGSGLEPVSSEACNAHLVLFVIDLVVMTLFPELVY